MDEIEEIKRKIDIVDFISSYLTLKKAGANYKALCPFHQEKTPSLMVSPEKQIWKCFGCGKGGSVFDFLMEIEGLEFPEALRILADRAGVVLPQYQKQKYQLEKDEKSRLYEINYLAAQFFHKILIGKEKAQFVRDYLKKRQISPEAIKIFMLGYAPEGNLLSNFLQARGYKMLDIEKAGLAVGGRDRFYDRLMFPIRNVLGNVVGFTGRAMQETKTGKYVNSPDSPIFNKSRLLYGLDLAKQHIKTQNRVIIMEGQTDVIAAYQAGFKNVVATSGTALTSYHLEILGRFTKNLSFCFDQDAAGEAATKRAIDLAHQMEFDTKIILLPPGKDPDELLKQNPEKFAQAVSQQKAALDYYFEITFGRYQGELNASQKREIAAELLPPIKNLANEIVRAHYLQKLADCLNVPEKYLYEAIEKIKSSPRPLVSAALPPPPQKDPIEERLLGIVLSHPEFLEEFIKNINIASFQDKELQELAKEIEKYYNKKVTFNLTSFKKTLPLPLAEKIDFLILPFENTEDKDLLWQEFHEYLNRLKNRDLEIIKRNFENKIKEAEKNKNREEVKKLIEEFQKAIIGK